MMGIHSKILVHWTGKDIETGSEADKARRYVDRLKDDLEKGLFARRTCEDSTRKMKVKDLVRICFTEIRLSQAQTHAGRYGKLGIGFTRDFVLDRGGCPVIYIPSSAEANACLLEDSIANVYEKSKDSNEVHRSSKWILAYVKRMSNGKEEGSGEFTDYYEEMEWRLVYDENPDNKCFTKDEGHGVHRLTFEAHDVKVLVFPDGETKQLALRDEAIRKYFSEYMPIVAVLDDCSNF